MGKKFSDFKKRIVAKVELAPETAGCTRLTMVDNTAVFLENHRGVIEYTGKRVVVNLGAARLIINGTALELESFGQENVAVCGKVDAIMYEKNG